MNTLAASLGQARKSQTVWFTGLALGIALWFAVYRQLLPFAQWLVAQTPIRPGSQLAASVEFFFYDTPKVLMLLTLVVFTMGVVRTFFRPSAPAPCWLAGAKGWAILPLPTSASSRRSARVRRCRCSSGSFPLVCLWV